MRGRRSLNLGGGGGADIPATHCIAVLGLSDALAASASPEVFGAAAPGDDHRAGDDRADDDHRADDDDLDDLDDLDEMHDDAMNWISQRILAEEGGGKG